MTTRQTSPTVIQIIRVLYLHPEGMPLNLHDDDHGSSELSFVVYLCLLCSRSILVDAALRNRLPLLHRLRFTTRVHHQLQLSISSPTPGPTSPAQPSPGEAEPLEDLLEPVEETRKQPTPAIDLSAGVVPGEPDPTPAPTLTPRATPRTESVVNASDYLSAGITKTEDTRRYRFRLQQRARVKGSFSARGNINVYIFGGYYSSGGAISADTIDVLLESGSYELVASARESCHFSVRLTAHYDQ